MSEFKKGCICSAFRNKEIDHMIHIGNCMGRMGAGIAKQIKEEYPEHYNHYLTYCSYEEDPDVLLGDLLGTPFDSQFLIVLLAQKEYGTQQRQLDYGALAKSLSTLSEKMRVVNKGDTIGVPWGMGCVLAGGDWTIVKEMVDFMLKDFEVVYYNNK